MAAWKEELVLKFIECYREHSLLWDPKHSYHYNKILRNDAWIDIANKVGKSVDVCKRKMASLLAALRREKSKMRKSKGAEEVYKSSWFAFKSLQFMWDKDAPQQTTSTIVTKEEPEEDVGVDETHSSTQESTETHDATKDKLLEPPGKNKKRRLEGKRLDRASESLTSCTANDECTDFGNLVAKKLRSYDVVNRSKIMYTIMGALLNADMEIHQNINPHDEYPGRANPNRDGPGIIIPSPVYSGSITP